MFRKWYIVKNKYVLLQFQHLYFESEFQLACFWLIVAQINKMLHECIKQHNNKKHAKYMHLCKKFQ